MRAANSSTQPLLPRPNLISIKQNTMKQTSNAIKFLLAQYRAIFKSAYFKGLATAAVVTVGLAAASSAQATKLTDVSNLPTNGEDITITGKSSSNGTNNEWEGLYFSGLNQNVENLNGSITISGGSTQNTNLIQASGDAKVTGNKFDLVINTSNASEGLAIISNIATDGESLQVDIGNLKVQKGTLDLAINKTNKSGDLVVTADQISIGKGTTAAGDTATVVLGLTDSYNAAPTEGTLTFGFNASEDDEDTVSSVTTLNKSGIIKFLGAATKEDKVVFAGQLEGKGGTLDFTSGSGTIKAYGTNVNADWTVGKAHTSVVDLEDLDRTTDINEGLLQFTQGTINIQANDTSASGGQILVSSGTLAIEGDTYLTSKGVDASGAGTVGFIKVAGTSADDNAVLRTSSDKILSFLNSDKYDGKSTTDPDQSGSIVLSGSAAGASVLELNDTETVDLYDLVTDDPNADDLNIKIGSTANVSGGYLNVSGGTIKAANLAISDVSTDLDLSKAFVEADYLTLGSADYEGTTPITISGTTVHKGLTLDSKGGTYTLNGTNTLVDDYFVGGKVTDENGDNEHWVSNTVAEANLINGDHIKLSGSANVTFKVTGGNWATDGQNITIGQSGVLTVQTTAASGSSGVYTNNGNPAYLTVNGGVLTIGEGSNSGSINVTGASGADATLDLSAVDSVKFVSGSIVVSGSALSLHSTTGNRFADNDAVQAFYPNAFRDSVGWGTLKLNQSTFDNYVGQSGKVTLTISGGGVVEVSDLHTKSYDVDNFVSGTGVAGKVAFSGANSYFVVNGDLNLYDGEVTTDGKITTSTDASNNKGLDIGSGTIIADRVTITNYGRKTVTNGDGTETTAVANTKILSGTLELSEGLSTNSSTLVLGDSTTNELAKLTLDAGINNNGILMGAGERTIEIVGGANSGGSIEVISGVWGTENLDLAVSGSGAKGIQVGDNTDENLIRQAQAMSTDDTTVYVADVIVDNFADRTGVNGVIQVAQQSRATFNTMQLVQSSTVTVNGTMVINGLTVNNPGENATDPAYVNPNEDDTVSTTAGISLGTANFTISGSSANLEFGATATSALVNLVGDPDDENSDKTTILLTANGIDQATFNMTRFGHVTLNFAADTSLDADDVTYLTSKLIGTGSDETAYLVLNNADLGIVYEERTDGLNEVKWENLKPFIDVVGSQATTDKLKTALVSNIGAGEAVKGHYGALSVDAASSTALTLNGPTSLHNAALWDGKFVTSERDGQVMGVQFANAETSLHLENGGTIGSITGYGTTPDVDGNNLDISSTTDALTQVQGSVTRINEMTVDSITEVTGDVSVNYLDLSSELNVLGSATGTNGDVKVNDADISSAAVLNAKNFIIGDTTIMSNEYEGTAIVMGQATVSDTVTVNGNQAVNGNGANLGIFGGSLTTTNLTLTNANALVQVGYDPESIVTSDDVETIYNDTESYSGYLEVTGSTVLNGGEFYVDPAYGKATAMASLDDLSGAAINSDDLKVSGTLDGKVFVGQNSALGIGSDSLATLQSKVARFQNGITLDRNDVGAVIYLGKAFTLGAGQSLTLTAGTAEEFLAYYNDNDGAATDHFQEVTATQDGDAPFLADTVYLGANTAILIDAAVAANADTSRTSPTAIITVTGSNNSTGTVIADGGDFVIDGDVRASTYQVFSGATIKYIDGTDYAVVNDTTAAHYDDNINVTTQNEFLTGVVGTDGSVKLGVAANGRAIMSGTSDPVYASLVAYAQGFNGVETTDEATGEKSADYLTNGYRHNADGTLVTDADGNPVKNYNYSNEFLQAVISTGNGRDAETVARLGMLGGVAQSAMAAGASTYDAIAGRMGVGSSMGNVTIANNTQGASLWLTPIYKNSESDGFEADNLDYGVDIDLYGVALGADFTMQNGVRVGAMFNVGSGDADGNGAGSAVSNDFDYYGFGVYAGYTYGAFSVLADVTYTVADNDVDGSTSLGQVSTSLDSTNLSVGVTGQYNLNVSGVDITPHAGLRFSSIDIDDYDVADIASYDADSLNIFSIPVGVTFAKEFQGEAWTWKPSLDITVQGNFGDDSADGTVAWAGIDNLKTELSSEVIDNFTYGATLGVAAQTGNFSMGLGINYTGSSNVDDYGVSANARFVF